MNLDYSALKKALASLERAIARATKASGDDELRDAVIQRFEYSYELCWKMLKRRLEQESPTPSNIDHLSFRELLREGAERGFVDDVEKWIVYREFRNLTSHVYDEEKAQKVYEEALKFFTDAKALLAKLEKKNPR